MGARKVSPTPRVTQTTPSTAVSGPAEIPLAELSIRAGDRTYSGADVARLLEFVGCLGRIDGPQDPRQNLATLLDPDDATVLLDGVANLLRETAKDGGMELSWTAVKALGILIRYAYAAIVAGSTYHDIGGAADQKLARGYVVTVSPAQEGGR